ncbi:MAG: DUF502 domain-containing protein [Syntrophales bacterium]|nr:DUF502 domain-containing protein [Syntrophales bacterium]
MMKKRIKRVFLTGLAVIIPVGVTVYILLFILRMMDRFSKNVMSRFNLDGILPVPVPGIDYIVLILLIFAVGMIVRSYLGKKIVAWGEIILDKIPIIRTIYMASKQLAHAMFSDDSKSFSRVVLIEYPRRDLYCIAFVSGDTKGELQEKTRENLINVFVPTTPNPTSGFLLMVPESDVINLDMSVDEAFALIVSGGIYTPQEIKKIIEEEKKIHADNI